MKKTKKIILGLGVITLLTTPIFRVNYFIDNKLEAKNYSILTLLIEDIKEQELKSHEIIAGNIRDRIIENYNDIKYN